MRDRPNSSSLQVCDEVAGQVGDLGNVTEFGFYELNLIIVLFEIISVVEDSCRAHRDACRRR